jgi:hypothetical protein
VRDLGGLRGDEVGVRPEFRVRVDLSKKKRKTVLSGRWRCGVPDLNFFFRSAAVFRASSISFTDQSFVSI